MFWLKYGMIVLNIWCLFMVVIIIVYINILVVMFMYLRIFIEYRIVVIFVRIFIILILCIFYGWDVIYIMVNGKSKFFVFIVNVIYWNIVVGYSVKIY